MTVERKHRPITMRVGFRLSQDEHDDIHEAADAEGVSVGAFVRSCAAAAARRHPQRSVWTRGRM